MRDLVSVGCYFLKDWCITGRGFFASTSQVTRCVWLFWHIIYNIPMCWLYWRELEIGHHHIIMPYRFCNLSNWEKTPWPESASKLHWPNDRRLSTKLAPTFADRSYHVVSVTDPYGRILGFLHQSRYFFFQVAPHCTHEAEWTPFQTHYFSETFVAPGIEPGFLNL
jgi:hypothetical protein